MHYVCIEDNTVTSILGYEPNVPSTIKVVQITDEQYSSLMLGTHYFNISTDSVVPVASETLARKTQEQNNAVEREFLNSTDWKVLRHIRQKALGITTSLTEDEYLQLETQRQQAASRIVQ